METLLKLTIFVRFLFSVGSEVSGSWGTVIVTQNFYFSNNDWLLRMRVWQLGLFFNCEITGANFFFLTLFFRNRISLILNWRLSIAGESRVTGLQLASLSRGRHDTARPLQTARHELTISPNVTQKLGIQKHAHAEISEANSNICRCVSWTIWSEFCCVSHLHKSRQRTNHFIKELLNQ